MQSFLGFYNYYNWFIKNYPKLFIPFIKLLQKDAVFRQGDQQQASFEELVHALTSDPVLRFDKSLTIHINASDVAIGATLTKMVDDMNMPVCYNNKGLNKIEAHLYIYERELYAIVQVLGKRQCYLVNRHTVVYNDH